MSKCVYVALNHAMTRGSAGAVPGGDAFAVPDRARRRAVAERAAAERLAPVRSQPAGRIGAERDDPRRVDIGVNPVIVLLGLHKIDRVSEARRLPQITGISPQHWHLAQLAPIALEMSLVHRVEARERWPQADVGFGDRVTDEVAAGCEPLRQPVEPLEELLVRVVVRVLR